MPNQELTFVIRARDAFSRVLTGAGASFRSFFRSMASGAAAGAAFGVVTQGLRLLGTTAAGLVTSWEASARAYAKLAGVLKATGYASGITSRQAAKLAADLQRMTGASDEATASAVALLAAQRNIRGETLVRAARASVDLAEGMRGAESEASNVEGAARMLGMALADPERGMTRLRRAGVLLTDEQEAQAKAFARAGETSKAQAVILDAVTTAYGGAAEAANKATGGLATLRQTIGDLREAIGGAIANSQTFRDAVDRIRAAAERLIASGGLELWAGRVKERFEAIVPYALAAGRAIGWLLRQAEEAGAFAGALAGGASIGEAWAGRGQVADDARAQAEADLASQRRRMAEEARLQDRAEQEAAAKARASRRAARMAAVAAGIPFGDEAAPGKTGTAGVSAEGLSGNADKAIEQIRDRVAAAEDEARQKLAGALAMEADAEKALAALDDREAANRAAEDAIENRANAVRDLKARVDELTKAYGEASDQLTAAQLASKLAETPASLAAARAEAERRANRPGVGGAFTRMLRRRAGKGSGEFDPGYVQTVASEMAPGAAVSRSELDKIRVQRAQAQDRAKMDLEAARMQLRLQEFALAEDRARLEVAQAGTDAERERGEAAVQAAQRAQAAEAKRLREYQAMGEKVAAAVAKAMEEAANSAYIAAEIAKIDAELARLRSAPDPLMATPATSRRQQVADFQARAAADAEAERQDQQDREREAMLRNRLARGLRVSKKGREFLEGRANLSNAENLAADKAKREAALEAEKQALQRDSNGLLREIRDYLKGNLEAS